jgi:hypothetical protein
MRLQSETLHSPIYLQEIEGLNELESYTKFIPEK